MYVYTYIYTYNKIVYNKNKTLLGQAFPIFLASPKSESFTLHIPSVLSIGFCEGFRAYRV